MNEVSGISDTCTVEISDPTQVSDHWANTITLFPNPAREFILVGGLKEKEVDIRLFSSRGELVLQTHERRIPLARIVPGEYFLRIMTSEGSVIKPVIKM
jgi:hypothetical protein